MTLKNGNFTRGELAKRSEVNAETIRYYEKINLMPKPQRNSAGYRIYQEQDLQGYALEDIRGLLSLVNSGKYTCNEIKERTAKHLLDVQEKIVDLQRMQHTLKTMVSTCDGGLVPDCPIIDELMTTEG